MKKLVLFCVVAVLLSGSSFAVLINQGLLGVPEIAPITVNGDLSDWAESSSVLTFGKWFKSGAGLASTTKIRYAFNGDEDMLYVGMETTEGTGNIWEIGTPTTDGTSASQDGDDATQVEFSAWAGGTGSIANQTGGTAAGISVAYTDIAGVMTVEVAMPIYVDWSTGGAVVDLVQGLLMYGYSDIFSAGWAGGDHQCADAEQIYSFGGARNTFATPMELIPEPATMLLLGLGGVLLRRRK